jgi:hypothetical protein
MRTDCDATLFIRGLLPAPLLDFTVTRTGFRGDGVAAAL